MPNTADAVWSHARSTPDRVALRGAGEPWTYRTLRDRAAAFAARLRAAGIAPGDRVLLVAPSVPAFAGAYYGIHAAGAIAVTANTMAPAPELEYLGADAGVSLVVGWHGTVPAPAKAAAALDVPYWPLTDEPAGDADAAPPHPAEDGDTAAILYTSGTTGRPKGAQLTHGNIIAASSIFQQAGAITADDRAGTALPLFHVYGQVAVMGTLLRAGGSLSLLERFDAAAMLEMLHRDRITVAGGVPTMWNAMMRAAGDAAPSVFAGLRHASSGGASLPGEIVRELEERFGCSILEGYGLTETTAAGTRQPRDRPRKPGSVGVALPGCEVAVRSERGEELPPGEVGEIHLRGPVVMKGYWNRPDATAEVLDGGGWLRTGDLGAKDAAGDLRIIDRKKDLVIRGGYNVYPREVEEVLYEHPDIVEAAVVGLPDDHYGEEVAAAIALRPGAHLDADGLRRWAKERLSAYKVPHVVAVVDELPKGATGKILKRAIDPAVFARE